jgi:hypothetical protein
MDMDQRPLYAPLREGKDFAVWPLYRRATPSCSGACEQGRKPCTAPDACFAPEPEDMHDGMGAVVVPVAVTAALAVVAVVAILGGWL